MRLIHGEPDGVPQDQLHPRRHDVKVQLVVISRQHASAREVKIQSESSHSLWFGAPVSAPHGNRHRRPSKSNHVTWWHTQPTGSGVAAWSGHVPIRSRRDVQPGYIYGDTAIDAVLCMHETPRRTRGMQARDNSRLLIWAISSAEHPCHVHQHVKKLSQSFSLRSKSNIL
jgi:hypothetical protein